MPALLIVARHMVEVFILCCTFADQSHQQFEIIFLCFVECLNYRIDFVNIIFINKCEQGCYDARHEIADLYPSAVGRNQEIIGWLFYIEKNICEGINVFLSNATLVKMYCWTWEFSKARSVDRNEVFYQKVISVLCKKDKIFWFCFIWRGYIMLTSLLLFTEVLYNRY